MVGLMDIFREAEKLLSQDRQNTYGDASTNYTRIAQIWSGLLGVPLDGKDVALMMAALKIYRASVNSDHKDSFVDAVAYISIAAQASSSSSSSPSSSTKDDL